MKNRRGPSAYAVAGSSLLWAWGYLCYLSSAMLPLGSIESVGLEYGWFASGLSSAALALFLMSASRAKKLALGSKAFLACATILCTTSIAYAVCPAGLLAIVALPCGIADGIVFSLFGVTWGTRYTLEGPLSFRMAIASFLTAFTWYLGISCLPHAIAQIAIAVLPLASWALWKKDVEIRRNATPSPIENNEYLRGEAIDGSWIARLLPWRSISIAIALTMVANVTTSLYFGNSYEDSESLAQGGVAVCALISLLSLGFIAPSRSSFSPEDCYRLVVTLCGIGLALVAFSGRGSASMATALISGCSMFTQTLIFATVSLRTHEEGLSPLLSFGVAQGLISAVVSLGNIAGKGLFALDASNDAVRAAYIAGLLVLLVVMASIAQINRQKADAGKHEAAQNEGIIASPAVIPNGKTDETESFEEDSTLITMARNAGLTTRETEVFGYLAKGRSYPRIAEELFITTGTVKTHARHIYDKLGVGTKQELIDYIEQRL